jgi:hypothetical protein
MATTATMTCSFSHNTATQSVAHPWFLRIGDSVDPATRETIESLVMKYWDVFYKAGVCKTILGFEFAIDTGGSQPVCCRKPNTGHTNPPSSSSSKKHS